MLSSFVVQLHVPDLSPIFLEPALKSAISLRSTDSFKGRIAFGVSIWALGELHATGCHCLSALPAEPGSLGMCL